MALTPSKTPGGDLSGSGRNKIKFSPFPDVGGTLEVVAKIIWGGGGGFELRPSGQRVGGDTKRLQLPGGARRGSPGVPISEQSGSRPSTPPLNSTGLSLRLLHRLSHDQRPNGYRKVMCIHERGWIHLAGTPAVDSVHRERHYYAAHWFCHGLGVPREAAANQAIAAVDRAQT